MTVERMIELLEIEKECVLRNASGECNRYCAGCDLLQDDTELHEMYTEALALLKAQEPRVLTFDEVKKHYNLPSVFPDDLEMQEDYYQNIQPLYFEFPNPSAWDVHWRGSNQVRTYLDEWEDRYNKTWRCWTSRPTDEQREKVKWE